MNSQTNAADTRAAASDSTRNSRFFLTFFTSIGAMVVLILGVALFALYQLRTTHAVVNDLTAAKVPALAHIYTMTDASLKRTIVLYEIVETNDWVALDERINRFRSLAGRFAQHRSELEQHQLSVRAQQLLKSIRSFARENEAMQDQVVEYVQNANHARAHEMLASKVIPAQRRMIDSLAELLEIHIAEADSHGARTDTQLKNAGTIVILMVPVALALALLIGFTAWRRLSTLLSTLHASNAALRSTLNDLNQQKLAMDAHAIVSIADAAGDIVYANDRFCKISGYSADELLGQNHRLLRSQEQDDHFFAEMWETISRGEIWTGVIGNRNKAGGLYWVNTTIVPFLDHAGLPYQYVSVRTDITDVKQAKEALAEANVQLERRVSERTEELAQLNRHLQGQIAERDRLEAELRRLASRDSLTGLFNRRRFDEEFARELARCQRNHSPMAMILLDIDHFKAINDRHGHQAGDAVLHQLADILRKRARSTDVVARWGGEEFVFLAVGSGSKSAVTVAESLRHTVETTDFASVGHVTCSAGVANYMPGDTLHSLFARADRALYRAKENDRNRVEVEQPAAATE